MELVQDAWTTVGGGNCVQNPKHDKKYHQNKAASKQNFQGEFSKRKGNIAFWGCQNTLFLWSTRNFLGWTLNFQFINLKLVEISFHDNWEEQTLKYQSLLRDKNSKSCWVLI